MDEEDIQDVSSDRVQQLGFKPQKEIIYNKLLPYAEHLDAESKKMFSEIKANLGKSVMLREMRPACGMWSARLVKYIKLYGLKFSKQDHIALVNLVFEILTIPNLEPYLVNKFAQTLMILLKKKYLLSPDDVTLEWRPLYQLCKRIMYTSHTQLGMYRYFSSLEHTLDVLVHAARYYFPVSATTEILEEFKPLMSPLAGAPLSLELLEWFLPIALPPEHAHLGYKLWFDDLIGLWSTCNNAPPWEHDMMWLMAKLASNNIGYIDWDPYIPLMFSRFIRSFSLPVVYKQIQAQKHHKIETSAICLWIVSTLGGGSTSQKYLDKFLKALESYFHPANVGRWLLKLKELLRKLPQYFIQRLHNERHKKPSWETPIPESHKLTEEDIDKFVLSIKGVAMQAVFSKLGYTDVCVALQHLATLRPIMIIPDLIDKMYSTLHSVTEPHKLTSVMQCVVAVARPLVQGARNGYPEGPTHVIPLLMSTLPGIDPNDFKKCFVTFRFISIFVALIPVVDSSKAADYYTDLTEEEEVMCAATASLEDFVLQFLDRVFVFIESSTLESTRMEKDLDKRSRIENLAEGALSSVCYTVLTQCSADIFKSALKKLHTFVTERILETKVAGHFVAFLCKSFARVNPEETLRCLVPHLCGTILNLAESDDVLKETALSDEFLYNLLILSEVVDSRSGVLPHAAQVTAVLDRTLHLACKEGYTMASKLLYHLLLSLTIVSPTEHRAVNHSYDIHVKDYLPIRDWGKPGNVHELNLEWHVPGKAEVQAVQDVVTKYLPMELTRLEKHISGEESLTRDELHCSLSVVMGLLGAQSVLPLWKEPPLTLLESTLTVTPFNITLGMNGQVTLPDGSNVRHVIAHTLQRLQEKMLACTEDDTRSLFAVIQIWEHLLLNRVKGTQDFEGHSKNFHMVKKVLEDKLVGKKRHMRPLLIDRVVLQHEARSERAVACLTDTHRMIMLSLLQLSCSHYSEVRTKAQATLFQGLDYFSYSYMVLIPDLVRNLQQDSVQHHESFKGSLYVLLGPKQTPVVSRHDWEMLLKMWPAIVKAKPSEKLSVIKLLENLVENVHKHFPTITISLDIPDKCVEAARALWHAEPMPAATLPTTEDVAKGLQALEVRNKRNLELYLSLLDSLMDVVEGENLHWRYHSMALCFIRDLVHPDLPYPARVVRNYLHTLVHDSLELRKIAIRSTVHLLKQQKRPHKKILVDVATLSEGSSSLPAVLTPGVRPDNLWLQYNRDCRPLNAEEWDKPRYMHHPSYGFFQWPVPLQMYAPCSEQPPLDRLESELKPEEREVHEFFSNTTNVAKLIEYLALEEKKGKDKFNGFRFILFKGLFRNHGDTYLPLLRPHLERLVVDKHESSQRCAAEIIAGLIRGSKHWPFVKMESLWLFLTPLIRTALANMTEETVPDWGTCFATSAENRDPTRGHWLLEVLLEDPLREEPSYLGCGRLYALQGALNQQEWRVSQLYQRLLDYCRPFLGHAYQNVRERLASVLINIFQPNMKLPGGCALGPHVEEFMAAIVPQLDVLYTTAITVTHTNHKSTEPNRIDDMLRRLEKVQLQIKPEQKATINGVVDNTINSINTSEMDTALRLFKTICKWIIGNISRSQRGALPQFYSVFPLICYLESYDLDEEMGKLCSMALAALAQAATALDHFPIVFQSIRKVAEGNSWWARSSVVDFLQVFTFHNMSCVLSRPEWSQQTTDIVLMLLADERVEVREKSAEVLSGLLHCDLVSDTDSLLAQFKAQASTKINKKQQGTDANNVARIRTRHSGILGLCAFISSSPYDVPDYVPDIFFALGTHLNDPQPIPSTIRKVLGDFNRTHHDSWDTHKLKFTERQLEVLTDLIVPPSYYA